MAIVDIFFQKKKKKKERGFRQVVNGAISANTRPFQCKNRAYCATCNDRWCRIWEIRKILANIKITITRSPTCTQFDYDQSARCVTTLVRRLIIFIDRFVWTFFLLSFFLSLSHSLCLLCNIFCRVEWRLRKLKKTSAQNVAHFLTH